MVLPSHFEFVHIKLVFVDFAKLQIQSFEFVRISSMIGYKYGLYYMWDLSLSFKLYLIHLFWDVWINLFESYLSKEGYHVEHA